MKSFVAFVGLVGLLMLPARPSQAQDDQYVRIYNLIQEADALRSSQQSQQALTKYLEARSALHLFQKSYPEWNSSIVNFRLSYLAGRIAEVTAQLPAAASTPTNPPPAGPGTAPETAPGVGELRNEIAALRTELRQVQAENQLLEAKVKEALAAQPASIDPRELTRAQERIAALEKENSLLLVKLEQQRADTNALERLQIELAEANRKLADQQKQTSQSEPSKELETLRVENSALRLRLNQLIQAAGSAAAVAPPSVAAAPDTARIRQLEAERDDLRRKLDAARKALGGRKNAATAAEIEALTRELDILRTRLSLYESLQPR